MRAFSPDFFTALGFAGVEMKRFASNESTGLVTRNACIGGHDTPAGIGGYFHSGLLRQFLSPTAPAPPKGHDRNSGTLHLVSLGGTSSAARRKARSLGSPRHGPRWMPWPRSTRQVLSPRRGESLGSWAWAISRYEAARFSHSWRVRMPGSAMCWTARRARVMAFSAL